MIIGSGDHEKWVYRLPHFEVNGCCYQKSRAKNESDCPFWWNENRRIPRPQHGAHTLLDLFWRLSLRRVLNHFGIHLFNRLKLLLDARKMITDTSIITTDAINE